MKDRDIGGAVYVYINKAGRWEKITPIRLNGTKDSMFGLAVENIGDVNQDLYKGNLAVFLYLVYALPISCCHIIVDNLFFHSDIAIGAPADDSGAGKVYIYHGSVKGINTSPAQVSLFRVIIDLSRHSAFTFDDK